MKLYTFDNGDGVKRVGVELSGFPGLIRDVRDFGLPYRDMTDLIRHITPSEKERISDPEAALDGHPLRLSAVRICSPIPHPEQDIICLGVNYAAHADESAQFDRKAFLLDRKKATYFSKRAYQTSGPDDLIPSYPELVTSLDYEAELAVIIGRDCKNVRERDVAACIFGYTVMNDVSARNLQTEHNQWYFGKSHRRLHPDGTVHRHRGRGPLSPGALHLLYGQRRAAPEQQYEIPAAFHLRGHRRAVAGHDPARRYRSSRPAPPPVSAWLQPAEIPQIRRHRHLRD